MHAHSLQTFTEQVAAFHSAVNYNIDISTSTSDEEAYKFASLYDRYFEYADTRYPRSCQADRRVPEADLSGLHEVHTLDFATVRERPLVTSGETSDQKALIVPSHAPVNERLQTTDTNFISSSMVYFSF